MARRKSRSSRSKRSRSSRSTSKSTRVMPYRAQVSLIKHWLRRQGIDPESVDVEHEIDPKRSYRENLRKIKEKVMADREYELDEYLRYAEMVHEHRSERAKALDEAKRAKVVIKPSVKFLDLIKKWVKRPDRYDIEGIDAFPSSKPVSRGRSRTRRHTRKRSKVRRAVKIVKEDRA